MLVLSRRVDESVMIGDDMTITITKIQGNRTRIKTQAPNHVPIWRSEITSTQARKPEARTKEATALVLTRESDQSINIGNDIVITVIQIRGDKVRLGIQAPRDVPVHRHEVYEAIQNGLYRPDAE